MRACLAGHYPNILSILLYSLHQWRSIG